MENPGPLQGGNSTKTRRPKLKQKLKQKTERRHRSLTRCQLADFIVLSRARRFLLKEVIILLGFGCLVPGHPSAALLHLEQFLECKSLAPANTP